MDLLVTDVMTGRTTGLARTVRRALASLAKAEVPHCVIGATALAVRGLPRIGDRAGSPTPARPTHARRKNGLNTQQITAHGLVTRHTTRSASDTR